MNKIYNFFAHLAEVSLPLTAPFSPKMKDFLQGRKETFNILQKKLKNTEKVIWFHMASLGEFEQGLPIIEIVKDLYPHHKIVVSFFSPSGYENKKNTPIADAVVYLPLDTRKNARQFLDLVHPDLVVFIKYEFWPNILRELNFRKIRTLLVSGGFRKDQVFFKPYGGWMKRSLKTFEHFFVQNKESEELLHSIGFPNVTVSGDTRFDRVSRQLEQDNRLDFVEDFLNRELCIVAGSTWPADENLLKEYINKAPAGVKFIIAPHQTNSEKIENFRQSLNKKIILYSEKEGRKLAEFEVLIIDAIGFLTRIYNYADIAYVGGAAGKTGLHNILEPATFGVPVIIGANFENFPEAKQLHRLAGLFSVKDKEELFSILSKLLENEDLRRRTGMISGHFIAGNTGATKIVEGYLRENPVKNS